MTDNKNLNKVIEDDFKGKIKVSKIEEQADGGAKIFFDVDDDFMDWFKNWQGMKRWSRKRFEIVLVEAIENLIKEGKEE